MFGNVYTMTFLKVHVYKYLFFYIGRVVARRCLFPNATDNKYYERKFTLSKSYLQVNESTNEVHYTNTFQKVETKECLYRHLYIMYNVYL